MKSIKETVNIINEDSFTLIRKVLSSAAFNEFMQNIRIKRKTTFRVNTIKSDKTSIMKSFRDSGVSISDFSLIPDCFIVNNVTEKELLKSQAVKDGLVYLQSISSQIPPVVLDPLSEETVLDLAAAPGSKTTQIAALMSNKGCIDAIEPDFVRKERLEYNIKLQGAGIVTVYHAKGEVFLSDVVNKYDKVLIDAPCSGEGRFNIYDKSSYASYRVSEIPKFHKLQVKLLRAALRAVKSGGTVVYSTCTLNTIENEEVVNEALEDVECSIIPLNPKFYQLTECVSIAKKIDGIKLRDDISNCLKITPSQKMEGFFIAKIVKK